VSEPKVGECAIFVDGACYPNPGTMIVAAVQVRVTENGFERVQQASDVLGPGTNNRAEFEAVRFGLGFVQPKSVALYTDCEHITRALAGDITLSAPELAEFIEGFRTAMEQRGLSINLLPSRSNIAHALLQPEIRKLREAEVPGFLSGRRNSEEVPS